MATKIEQLELVLQPLTAFHSVEVKGDQAGGRVSVDRVSAEDQQGVTLSVVNAVNGVYTRPEFTEFAFVEGVVRVAYRTGKGRKTGTTGCSAPSSYAGFPGEKHW
ncbi:MAG: hypothetical protein H6502_04100 [Candidatus Woesearchaeota archaeon]|nr:MAG: hypothetical protein H6502_04100 [Candidatus Woesearchaeota archaeon]